MENMPVRAPFNGTAEFREGDGYGYYVYFTISPEVDPDQGILIFGDLSGEDGWTSLPLNEPTEVTAGTIIGWVHGYDDSISSGPHLHFEYWPSGNWKDGNPENPVFLLAEMGVGLSGDPGGYTNKGEGGGIKWSVESLVNLGNSFNFVIKTFMDAANNAAKYLKPYAISILMALCVIDLTLPILLSGMSMSLNSLVWKIIRYSGIMAAIIYWPSFIDKVLLNFVTTMSGVSTGNADLVEANISQPQLLLQKAVYLISPALDKFQGYNIVDMINNGGSVITIYLLSFAVVLFFSFLGFYVTCALVEFYISAGLCIVSVPFSAWNLTKFIPEGSLGHLVSSALKLLLVSFMTFLIVSVIQNAKPTDIFSQNMDSQLVVGTAPPPETAFNSPYIADARRIAAENGIPPDLFLALISTESSWDPYAESPVGAVGLGQLMPGTAAEYGCYDRTDPISNMNASAKYFKHLHDVMGNWDYALAGYNGGEFSFDPAYGIPSWLRGYVEQVHSNMNGVFYLENNITSEQLTRFVRLCMAVIFLALLGMIVPKRIMRSLSGTIQLPGK